MNGGNICGNNLRILSIKLLQLKSTNLNHQSNNNQHFAKQKQSFVS